MIYDYIHYFYIKTSHKPTRCVAIYNYFVICYNLKFILQNLLKIICSPQKLKFSNSIFQLSIYTNISLYYFGFFFFFFFFFLCVIWYLWPNNGRTCQHNIRFPFFLHVIRLYHILILLNFQVHSSYQLHGFLIPKNDV